MRIKALHSKVAINRSGFTVLELVVVIIIIGILAALFLSTYAGVQRNNRNQERQRDINDLYQQFEAYYVENAQYPTFADMNSATWVTTNFKTLSHESLRDPSSNFYQLVARPEQGAYAYQVSSATGAGCNDTTTPCAHYTLTATLENSPQKVYVKSSLN